MSLFIATFSLVSCGSDFDKIYEDYLIRHVVYKAGDCTGNYAVSNLPQDETEYVLADKPILKAKPVCSGSSGAKEFTAWQIEGSDNDGKHQPNDAISFSRPDEGFTATALWGSLKPPKPPKPSPEKMITVPTNGSTTITFPMNDDNNSNGMDDATGTIKHKFAMAQTEVTYELWKKVYDWANKGSNTCNTATGQYCYTFANEAWKGGAWNGTGYIPKSSNEAGTVKQPVTNVSYRDAVVWSNAYTEWYNATKNPAIKLTVVYCTDVSYTTPLRTSTKNSNVNNTAGSEDKPYIKASSTGNTDMENNIATGFRLPTSAEWEFAARLRKDATNAVANGTANPTYPIKIGGTDYWFTQGNSASGATKPIGKSGMTPPSGETWETLRDEATRVAVYGKWYDGSSWVAQTSATSSTADVATKSPNALGIYDMSGNVSEWCYSPTTTRYRSMSGGSFALGGGRIPIGNTEFLAMIYADNTIGFRVARTVP